MTSKRGYNGAKAAECDYGNNGQEPENQRRTACAKECEESQSKCSASAHLYALHAVCKVPWVTASLMLEGKEAFFFEPEVHEPTVGRPPFL